MSEDQAYGIAAAELRQFIEKIEQGEAEKADAAERVKEIYAEAGQKFDLGYNGTAALPVATELKPGAVYKVSITVDGTAAEMSVPVLDGTLPEYKAILDAAK